MAAATELAGRELYCAGLYVQEFGSPAAPAVLFSTGLGGLGSYWQPQIPAFSRSHRVVIYDHRGTGRSDRSALAQPYSVRQMADDIGFILDELQLEAAHLVGHAAGALAVLDFAWRQPSRLLTLTSVNGWAAAEPHLLRCLEIRRDAFRRGGAEAYLLLQPLFLYPAMETFDIRDALQDITTPSLIIATEDDQLVPCSASTVLVNGLARANSVTLPWGGHAVNVTAPEIFNAKLANFIDHWAKDH